MSTMIPALHERLKLLREEKGLNISQAAEFLGISRKMYSKYESGYQKGTEKEVLYAYPSAKQLLDIAEKYQVTTDYLLGKEKYRHWADIKVEDVTGLSANATQTLSQIFYEDWNSPFHSALNMEILETIKHGSQAEINEVIQKLDQPKKSFAKSYLQQLQTSRKTIDALCKIITHSKFMQLLLTIKNAQSCFSEQEKAKADIRQIKKEWNALDIEYIESIDNPFDAPENSDYTTKIKKLKEQTNNQERISKEQFQFYNANIFLASSIFTEIVRDICESN